MKALHYTKDRYCSIYVLYTMLRYNVQLYPTYLSLLFSSFWLRRVFVRSSFALNVRSSEAEVSAVTSIGEGAKGAVRRSLPPNSPPPPSQKKKKSFPPSSSSSSSSSSLPICQSFSLFSLCFLFSLSRFPKVLRPPQLHGSFQAGTHAVAARAPKEASPKQLRREGPRGQAQNALS